MMIYQYTAAALASEHKVLAHPASVDSIPTSANQEDHVSMGSIAARHARAVLAGVERIVAIELVVGAQALDLRREALARAGAADHVAPVAPAPSPGAGVAQAHARIRARIGRLDRDREPGPDLTAAFELVHDGTLVDLVGDRTSR
jgi:histidine ammonia-lyase